MKKMLATLGLFLALAMVIPAFAVAGQSSIVQLKLVEKDPSDWSIVEDGAWGRLTYNKASGRFVFNGHDLVAGEDYTLINFARDTEWPAHINILGAETANVEADVHIAGNYAYANLEYDETPGTGSTAGYKIWLVLTDDVADSTLAGWNPTEYLFESELI